MKNCIGSVCGTANGYTIIQHFKVPNQPSKVFYKASTTHMSTFSRKLLKTHNTSHVSIYVPILISNTILIGHYLINTLKPRG
jgi:hypothetical protein